VSTQNGKGKGRSTPARVSKVLPPVASGGWRVELIALGLLVLVAGGAAAVGVLVSSMAAAANWAFGLACTALVGWAVTRLGILSSVERLLRFWRRR
jgi:hypothetical protein